jgi:RNA polymerase sigma-70 factor (ECF subfamily)
MPFRPRDELVALLPRLRRYARALCKEPNQAEDLVQTACLRALSGIDGFIAGSRFDAWVFRILRNHWIDTIRHSRNEESSAATAEIIKAGDGETGVIAKLTLQDICSLIDSLPAEQREVLLLVCVEDLTYRETAEFLGVPIGTVMSRLARARQKLIELTSVT